MVVREHQELVFISQGGLVQRTGVRGISQQGRTATGVRVMNVRDGDEVSAVALIVESEPDEGVPSVTDDVVEGAPPLDAAADGSGDLPTAGEDDSPAAPDEPVAE
jgi:DNA gyrase subunit A